MKNKKSVLVLIAIAFWLLYAIFSVVSYTVSTSMYFDQILKSRKAVLDLQVDYATHFLMNQKPMALVPRLQHGIDSHQYDFFLLKQKDKVLGYYVNTGKLEDINFDFAVTEGFVEMNRKVRKTIEIFDYKLTIGFNFDMVHFLAWELGDQKVSLIVDLLLVTFLVFVIVYFMTKDILSISKIMGSKNRKGMDLIQVRSLEAQNLISASRGLEELNQNLRSDKLLLASSLGPAIKAELEGGQAPPYSFACTLARVDLNGYTQLALQKSPEDLVLLLSEYFQNSRDLIERYQGLIYQYVGDEIIFFFKEDGVTPSVRKAVCAIRSLFEMSQNLVSPGLPDGLRLKASLVSGTLQFVKMDQGHSFNGLPLIESVRMLGQVTEKSENTLIVYSDAMPEIADLCESLATKTTVFKGFEKESSLSEIRKFVSCEQALKDRPESQVSQCFRSPQDLILILAKLRALLEQKNEAAFFNLMNPLRDMILFQDSKASSPELRQKYSELLNAALNLSQEPKILASVVLLSQNILSDLKDPELIKILRKCEVNDDPRVRANTIMALAYFGQEVQNLSKLFASPHNRLAANAMLIAGQEEFNRDLSKRIQDFLKSKEPRFIASGLFLVASLYDYHRKNDPVYFKANTDLHKLIGEVPKFLDHSDTMVRLRAQKSFATIQAGGVS